MSENPPPYQPNQPNPSQGQPSQPQGQYPPPGQYVQPGQFPVAPVAPNSSKATTSLILGIVSIVMCGLFLGIPAMILARQAKREIRESQGRVGGEGLATAGFITGLIGTIWSVVAGVLFVLLIIFGAIYADDIADNCRTVTDADGNTSVDCGDL
jgi:hypothetical protein